jgi:hypothetical protein
MRVVIYDEESLEPITVANLPGLSDMALETQRQWRVLVPGKDGFDPDSRRFLDLTFEPITRVTLRYGEQSSWLCLARAADLAMLLSPDWLPGQSPVVQKLEEENDRLKELLVLGIVPANQ